MQLYRKYLMNSKAKQRLRDYCDKRFRTKEEWARLKEEMKVRRQPKDVTISGWKHTFSDESKRSCVLTRCLISTRHTAQAERRTQKRVQRMIDHREKNKDIQNEQKASRYVCGMWVAWREPSVSPPARREPSESPTRAAFSSQPSSKFHLPHLPYPPLPPPRKAKSYSDADGMMRFNLEHQAHLDRMAKILHLSNMKDIVGKDGEQVADVVTGLIKRKGVIAAAKKMLKRKLKIKEEEAVVEIKTVDHRADLKKKVMKIDPEKAKEQAAKREKLKKIQNKQKSKIAKRKSDEEMARFEADKQQRETEEWEKKKIEQQMSLLGLEEVSKGLPTGAEQVSCGNPKSRSEWKQTLALKGQGQGSMRASSPLLTHPALVSILSPVS